MNQFHTLTKLIKNTGAAVSVVLLVAMSISAFVTPLWRPFNGFAVALDGGVVVISTQNHRSLVGLRTSGWYDGPGRYKWRGRWSSGTWGWSLELPLWVPLLPLLLITIAAWRVNGRALRRLERGQCPACAYSREGLAPDVHCPECGTPGSATLDWTKVAGRGSRQSTGKT